MSPDPFDLSNQRVLTPLICPADPFDLSRDKKHKDESQSFSKDSQQLSPSILYSLNQFTCFSGIFLSP